MDQPSGFVDPTLLNHVCLLKKSLYDLKQAPRAWFAKLSTVLISLGFVQCLSGTSLFVSHTSNHLTYALIYVDDIIVTGSSSDHVSTLIQLLNSQFALKDMVQLSYFLGIQATFSDDCLIFSQQRYILDLLQRTDMSHYKPLHSPVCSVLIFWNTFG